MHKIEVSQKERNMHEHIEFKHAHVLQYCKHCDVVYCDSCGKEWKKEKPNYIWYNTSPQWGTTTTIDLPDNLTVCAHGTGCVCPDGGGITVS